MVVMQLVSPLPFQDYSFYPSLILSAQKSLENLNILNCRDFKVFLWTLRKIRFLSQSLHQRTWSRRVRNAKFFCPHVSIPQIAQSIRMRCLRSLKIFAWNRFVRIYLIFRNKNNLSAWNCCYSWAILFLFLSIRFLKIILIFVQIGRASCRERV